jgi:hypothetical protein
VLVPSLKWRSIKNGKFLTIHIMQNREVEGEEEILEKSKEVASNLVSGNG